MYEIRKGSDRIENVRVVYVWSSTYVLVFIPPLFPTFWRLRQKHTHTNFKSATPGLYLKKTLTYSKDTAYNIFERMRTAVQSLYFIFLAFTFTGSASSLLISPLINPSSTDWNRLTTSCTSPFCCSPAKLITLFW